jgi:hypothetical protein
MKFSIYQANISREVMNHINQVGWGGDFGEYKMEAQILSDVKFSGGSEKFVPEMSEYYCIVASIHAQDLDDVFEAGNIQRDRLNMIAERMHSISVGDIIECHNTGECFMVDPCGFTKVDFLQIA